MNAITMPALDLKAPNNALIAAIYKSYSAANAAEGRRAHLGASEIGKECRRELWYGFRWAFVEDFGRASDGEEFELDGDAGRMCRLFQRGHREEAYFVDDLRAVGADVQTIDPDTGRQFGFKDHGGHFAGSIDAQAASIPGMNADWALVECKTHNAKSFNDLRKHGVETSKPRHFAQCLVYCRKRGLARALYLAVCKNDDRLYAEVIELHEANAKKADELIAKAGKVIFAAEPPARAGKDASSWVCKFCPAIELCHGTAMPQVNCRTCAHSTPEPTGGWSCAKWKAAIPTKAAQEAGCDHHVFMPALLVNGLTYVEGNEAANYAEYRDDAGRVVRNGTRAPGVVPSAEMAHVPMAMLGDAVLQESRDKFDGAFVAPIKDGIAIDLGKWEAMKTDARGDTEKPKLGSWK